MAGTFGSFGIGLSAMRYSQTQMDVAGNNIANAATEGYVRRRVEAESLGAPIQPALWSRYDRLGGDGVGVTGITRMVDELAVSRSRREHSAQSFLDTRATSLARVESGMGEPGPDGVAAALADLRAAFDDLANNPGDQAARAQVLVKAGIVADALKAQAGNVKDELADQGAAILDSVTEINNLTSDLADVNKAINTATLSQVDASTLMDNREKIALRLAELTGGTASLRPDGGYDFAVGGVKLVDGQQASVLSVAGGLDPATGTPTGGAVTFAVAGAAGTGSPAIASGEVGARAGLIVGELQSHLDGLNGIAESLASALNTAHAAGFDKDGAAGGPLYAFTAGDAASSLSVAITDPRKIAASGLGGGPNLDAGNAVVLGDAMTVQEDYRRLISSFGAAVASTTRLATNQQVLTNQVDAARDQTAGVNLDEEMTNMLAAQRGYEAAARVIRTLDDVLDTLINRMAR